jgi:hypothetical protein
MRRRTPTRTAELHGGGPADGSRVPVEGDVAHVDVPCHGPVDGGPAQVVLHRYERGPDGRFGYAGPVEAAALPERVHRDAQAHGLAALGHDAGPSPTAVVAVIVLLAVVMYAFASMA